MAIDVTVSGLNTVVDVEFAETPSDIPPETYIALRGEKGDKGDDGQDGYTPIKGVDYFDGQDGADGTDGADGFSPIATVSKVGDTATITITDKDGTTTATVQDGTQANVLTAEFGITTYADVKDAYDDGAILICTVPDGDNTMTLQLVYFDYDNEIFFFAFPTSDGWYLTQLSNADGWGDGQFFFASTDVATQLADGLMSALDKQKLDGLSKRNIWYGTCSTSSSQSPKAITTASGDFSLTAGNMLCVLFSHTNSLSSVSLQVDGGTSKSAYSMDGTSDISYRWGSDEVVMFVYDGTKFIMLEQGLASTTQHGITKLNNTVTSTSTSEAATANAVKSAYDNGGVQSVNGSTGAVTLSIPSNVSDLNNDSGFITSPNVVYCTCSTASGTAAKVATIVAGTLSSLTAGAQAIVKFTNANGKANPTLKIGTTDAKSIMRYGTTAPSTSAASSWNAGSCVLFIYDGTYWQMIGYLNTTYSEISQANITNGSGSSSGLVTGRRAKAAVEAFAPIKDVTVDGTSVLSGTTAAIDLSGKANASHTHTKSEITDFPALAAVATTGNYNSLTDKPAIHNVPSGGSSGQVLSKASGTDYDLAWVNQSGGGGGITDVEVDGTSVVTGGVAEIDLTGKSDIGHTHTTSAITDFPSLATVATSGSYNDLTDKPTIPTVNNATLTIQKNGTTVNTFTANASSNVTANITVPTVTDTYSGTSSDGMSGKAVKSAIDALDGTVSGTAGAGKTLTAFSQTDGKVSATFGSISITKSQVSDFPSLATVATSGDYGDLLNKPTFSGSTATKTPTEVKTAIDSGNFIDITHLDPVYGLIQANNFNYSAGANSIVANVVFYYSLVGLLSFELIGNLNDDTWTNNAYILAQTSDIPTLATVATSGDYDDLTKKPTVIQAQGTSDVSVTTSAIAQVPLKASTALYNNTYDAEVNDTLGGIKIKTAGIYRVQGSLYMTASGNSTRFGVYLYKSANSGNYSSGVEFYGGLSVAQNASLVVCSPAILVSCAENDVIYLGGRTQGAGASISGNNHSTFINVERVG